MLSELCTSTLDALHLQINSVTYYTDSTITLAWIQAPTTHWTTFVANRVSKIQDSTDVNSWKHVKSDDNPADYLSRGLLPLELLQADRYWKGPSFLYLPKINLEEPIILPDFDNIPERRQRVHSIVATTVGININNFSTFTRAQRAIAYCLRFLHNCQVKKHRVSGPLLVSELQAAERTLITMVQKKFFPTEFNALESGKSIDKKSKLVSLNPFIDEYNVLRVGGRLQQSILHPDQMHPIILPKGHRLTDLITTHLHIKTLHAGPQLLPNVIPVSYTHL